MSLLKISYRSTVENGIQLVAHLSQVMLVNCPLSCHLVCRYEILPGERVIVLRDWGKTTVELRWGQLYLAHL